MNFNTFYSFINKELTIFWLIIIYLLLSVVAGVLVILSQTEAPAYLPSFAYLAFTYNKAFFSSIIGVCVVLYSRNPTFKKYLWALFVMLVFPMDMVLNLLSFFTYPIFGDVNDQFFRLFLTVLAVVLIFVKFFITKNRHALLLSIGSGVYLIITFVIHFAVIDAYLLRVYLPERLRINSLIASEQNEKDFFKLCKLYEVNCFNGVRSSVSGSEVKIEYVNNLVRVFNNREKYKNGYIFENGMLIRVKDDVFVSDGVDKERFKFINPPIHIVFAKAKSGGWLLDFNMSKHVGHIRLWLSLFNIATAIIWVFGVVGLLKLHKDVK